MEEWLASGGPTALDTARRVDGLSQAALAQRLGVGQPHLSKLIKGKANPSVGLRRRIDNYIEGLRGRPYADVPDWMREAIALAETSPEFRDLIVAATRLIRHKKE